MQTLHALQSTNWSGPTQRLPASSPSLLPSFPHFLSLSSFSPSKLNLKSSVTQDTYSYFNKPRLSHSSGPGLVTPTYTGPSFITHAPIFLKPWWLQEGGNCQSQDLGSRHKHPHKHCCTKDPSLRSHRHSRALGTAEFIFPCVRGSEL